MDGTISGDSVDSVRVKTALLAANSQHTRYRSRAQGNSSPMSSWPPTNHAERPYGHVRWQRRHVRLKVKTIKVSQTPEVETAYLERVCATQPHGNASRRAYRVIGPRRQRGMLKIERINDKRSAKVLEVEMTHLRRT